MKSSNIVFVPGLFGWGPGELRGFPYWGDALQQFKETRFKTHWVKCGPISSFHDRACEVFARIEGTKINYGAKHSTAEGHAQTTSRDFTGQGFVPDWSENNPVILIGHSAGAQTCLQLQQLLAEKFWYADFGVDSTENWIEAIICVSGVLNGSTLTYLTCDESTGRLKRGSDFLVQSALDFIAAIRLAARPIHDLGRDYDLYLDQWIGKANATSDELLVLFKNNPRFVKGEDNLAFDLSLQGCLKANQKFKTGKETYYFTLVTRATHEEGLPFGPKVKQPDRSMSFLLKGPAEYQALRPDFAIPPIQDWGADDLMIDKWRENDGAVSSISQRFPFTAGAHPLGGDGIFARKPETIEKGNWYVEDVKAVTGLSFDHFDPAVGAKLKGSEMEVAQLRLYSKLAALLQSL
jgi:triacylglycerol lipase